MKMSRDDITLSDDVIQLCSEDELELQQKRDADCEARKRELEERKTKADERNRRVMRKLKGLGLRWKQVEKRRLAREESARSLVIGTESLAVGDGATS